MIKKKISFKKLLTIWITVGIAFAVWLIYSFESHGVSKNLFENSNTVSIKDSDDYYLFTPAKALKNVFIFYPGALVDPKAYIPLCRKIAENGLKVYLIKMPCRLASKGYNKPKELNILKDPTKTYILCGHSQGAKMAAQFVYENPKLIDKLILIGSTHPRDISLADRTIPILKIYGSEDGIAEEKSILSNKSKLPNQTKFMRIAGANHSQFGYYGFQLGDNSASISREQQLSETLDAIFHFLN